MDQLDRIEQKLDRLDQRQDGMDITVVKQQGLLDLHIRRSTALEETVALLQKEQGEFREFLKERALLWRLIGQVVGGVSAGAGAIISIWKALQFLGLVK